MLPESISAFLLISNSCIDPARKISIFASCATDLYFDGHEQRIEKERDKAEESTLNEKEMEKYDGKESNKDNILSNLHYVMWMPSCGIVLQKRKSRGQ